MSLIAQVVAAITADVRSFVDDIGRGFVLGGVAGAIVVVLRKSRISAASRPLIVSRWTLAGVVAFLSFLLLLELR